MRQRLPAYPQSIAALRSAVVELARRHGASDLQRDDIAVAVSEALSNVVTHAYPGRDAPGIVEVRGWVAGQMLVVLVSDEGVGMRPHDSGGPLMGLRLIFQLTERLEFVDTTPGACVRMTFVIGPPGAGAGAAGSGPKTVTAL